MPQVGGLILDELCPSCGDWCASLDDLTGWCYKCTPTADTRKPFSWLEEHGDSIDRKLVQGVPLKQAIKEIADEIRPLCRSCGDPIQRGVSKSYGHKSASLFCTKKAQCRLARRRYAYYKHELGLARELALQQALASLHVPSKKAQAA